MNRILSVAQNTFIETKRDRVLYSLIFFAFLMIGSSLIFASISGEQYNKIVKDIGLTAMSFIGIVVSIFLGTGLVYKEIERKTVYNIFSKPIRRYEFVFGKYLGLALTVLINTVVMGLILFLIVLYTEVTHGKFIAYYYGGNHIAELFKAIYFQYLEFLIVMGIALVFSSFTTPVLSLLFTFFLFIIGRFSSDIKLFAEEIGSPIVKTMAEVIYIAIPNLEKFNIRSMAVYGGNLSTELMLYTTVYAVLYAAALLVLAVVIFQKREFK